MWYYNDYLYEDWYDVAEAATSYGQLDKDDFPMGIPRAKRIWVKSISSEALANRFERNNALTPEDLLDIIAINFADDLDERVVLNQDGDYKLLFELKRWVNNEIRLKELQQAIEDWEKLKNKDGFWTESLTLDRLTWEEYQKMFLEE